CSSHLPCAPTEHAHGLRGGQISPTRQTSETIYLLMRTKTTPPRFPVPQYTRLSPCQSCKPHVGSQPQPPACGHLPRAPPQHAHGLLSPHIYATHAARVQMAIATP